MTRSKTPRTTQPPTAQADAADAASEEAATPYGKEFLGGLERGLQVLTLFNEQNRTLTIADVARLIDTPRATARRAINTLTHLGYLEEDGRLYSVTPKVLVLASAYANANPVTALLQPACERLCQQLDADGSAAVLDGTDVVRIAHAAPSRSISLVPGIGYRVPVYCSALGRAMLSAMDDRSVKALLKRSDPVKRTSHTVTGLTALFEEVQLVRRNGYALVDREAEDGYRSIAVPIRNVRGMTVAALNVGVRIEVATAGRMKQEFLPALRALAQELEQQLL